MRKNILSILLFAFAIAMTTTVKADEYVYQQDLIGTSISNGTTLTAVESLYPYPTFASSWVSSNSIRFQEVKNQVTLKIDHSNLTVIADYVVQVEVAITYEDELGVLSSPVNKTLEVSHSSVTGSHTDKNAFVFSGGHAVNVEVVSITLDGNPVTQAPINLKLENKIIVDRLFDFNYTAVPTGLNISFISISAELDVTWPSIAGAEEYQLEWLHINNYNGVGGARPASQLPYNFNINATRISTSSTNYRISNVFEQGYVLFRVRGLTYDGINNEKLVAGAWSCGSTCSGTVDNHNAKYQIISAHEGDNFNYQYTVNYAEEGKKKEVVSYFNGSLRNQQVVSKINSDDQTIVGETFYDHQGRAAIQALPAPTNESAIKFYPNYNQNLAGTAYSRDNFDKNSDDCAILAEEMSTASGASRYYSPLNPNQQENQAYVPNANGFPFTHVEYEADNTGRIRRQGGIGPVHQLSSDPSLSHETKYFYGKPSQEHLNRVFGAEVGPFSHYKKNMVVDANRQISVSYLDQQGRVVATSLAGNTPENVIALPSSKEDNPDRMNINVLDNQPGIPGSSELVSTFHHLVSTAGPHDFNYNLVGATFDDMGSLPEDVCLDCVYDLVIDVQDECGRRPDFVTAVPGFTELPINITLGTLDDICEANPDEFLVDFQLYFDIGKYVITRRLQVNQEALDAHLNTFIGSESNTVLQLDDFINNEIAQIDFSQCEDPDCQESCLLSLGMGATAQEIAACQLDCELPDRCDALNEIMKGDVTPGGQYATYVQTDVFDANNTIIDVTYTVPDRASILYSGPGNALRPLLASGTAVYQISTIDYRDANGNPSIIDLPQSNGTTVPTIPQDLTVEQFIQFFDNTWANVLVDFHPERCNIAFCESTNLGLKYDYLMRSVDTYEEALALGLLNGTGLDHTSTPIPNFGTPNGVWPLNSAPPYLDPFFQAGGIGFDFVTSMDSFLTMYEVLDTNGVSTFNGTAWGIATLASGICNKLPNQVDCDAALANYIYSPFGATDECTRDKMWLVFRALYLQKKNELFELAQEAFLNDIGNDCPNEFIEDGNSANPFGFKVKRFKPFNEGLEGVNDLLGPTPNPITAQNQAVDSMNTQCMQQAEGAAMNWMAKLIGCAPNQATWGEYDAINNPTPDPNFALIKAGFIEIYLENCGDANPVGSTSMAPGTTSPSGYTSFQDVLEQVLGVAAATDFSCNANLISFPNVFGYDYFSDAPYSVIDTCACDKILSANETFLFLQSQGTLPAGVTSREEYFEFVHGLELEGFSSKLCACNMAFEESGELWSLEGIWDTVSIAELVLTPEFVPTSLGCNECIGCLEVEEHFNFFVDSLETRFGFTLEELEGDSMVQLMTMISTYLDNTLGLDLTYLEYLDFVNNCTLLDSNVVICEPTPVALELQDLLNTLITFDDLSNPTCLCFEPYASSFGSLLQAAIDSTGTICDQTITTTEETDTSYTIQLSGTGTNCTIQLAILEPGYDISRLVPTLSNIRVDTSQSPIDPQAFLIDGFVIDDNNNIVPITISGYTDCIIVMDCYTTTEEYTLCSDPIPADDNSNDCEEMLINIAIQNATNLYQNYIDSVTADFIDNYTLACLAVTDGEVFDMEFDDNEHHYTLYYYDQAGNLVRTIPPAGVEFVPENLWAQIDSDRDAGIRSIYTKHRMATTYKYNSLNQLIKQSVPDHENFDDLRIGMTGLGLPANMDVETTTFTDNNTGILFGTDPNDPTRSLIFKTVDGGLNWSPISDIGVNHINAVKQVGANVYAVGDKGTFLLTTNGGVDWTLLNIGTLEDLVGVHFNTNLMDGVVITESGSVFQTNNGSIWTQLSTSLSSANSISEAYFKDNNNGVAVGLQAGQGVIYTSSNGGTTWTNELDITSTDLNDVQMLDPNNGFAIGIDGTLLKTSNGGDSWQKVNTDKNDHFVEIDFSTTTTGYLRDANDQVWYTQTGGTIINPTGGLFSQGIQELFFTNTLGYAVDGNNNLFNSANLISWSPVGAIPGINNVRTIFFESNTVGYAAGNAGAFYQTLNGGTTWSAAVGSGLIGDITKVYINDGIAPGGTPPVDAKGFAINTAGQFFFTDNTLNAWNQITTLPASFVAIDFEFSDDDNGYLLSNDGQVAKTVDAGENWSLVSSIPSSSMIAIAFNNVNDGIAVGSDGSIFNTSDGGTNWNNRSENLRPLALNGVHAFGSATLVVGDGGTALLQSLVGGTWKTVTTGISEKLHASFLNSTTAGIIAGENSTIIGSSNIGTLTPTWSAFATPTVGETINTIKISGTRAIAITENSEVWHSANVGSISAFTLNYTNATPVNHAILSGTTAYVVGNDGSIVKTTDLTNWNTQGTEIRPARVTSTFTAPGGTIYSVSETGVIGISTDQGNSWVFNSVAGVSNLNAIHFYSNTHGVAVGNNAIVRTTNGGLSWSLVSGVGTNDYNDVYMLSTSIAFAVADNGVIKKINGGSASTVTSSVLDNLNSVDFYGNVGFIAGDNGVLLKTDNGLAGTVVWNKLEATNNEDWVAFTDPNNLAITANLNDIQMVDYATIHAVGDNGVIIKSIDGGVSWVRKESGTTENLHELTFNSESTAILSGTTGSALPFTDNSDRFSSRFFYDRLGRLVASQNSKQYNYVPARFSYTQYDFLGRVAEVGELILPTTAGSPQEPTPAVVNAPNYPNNWSANRIQVSSTHYDTPLNIGVNNLFGADGQKGLRNRVATASYEEFFDGLDDTYDYATHYNYDIHGNVDKVIQDNPELKHLDQQYKEIEYLFDLVSGNVNEVMYQKGDADQFFHKYMYDGDNRITEVLTSSDGVLWDRDAHYKYYEHGPLSRTEMGDLNVQGMDYAYSVQGWLKGVNSSTKEADKDMGQDGVAGATNELVAKDAFGYALSYYTDDYQSIGSSAQFLAQVSGSGLDAASPDLFNGNISKMVTAISPISGSTDLIPVQGMAYNYDQLNRLSTANAYREFNGTVDGVAASNSFASATNNNDYNVQLSYDANGNIETLHRNGHTGNPAGQSMDELSYQYELDVNGEKFNNRLLHVNDAVAGTNYTVDIDDQGAFNQKNETTYNYTYDEIGNLMEDKQEEIDEIVWKVNGKVEKVIRTSASTKPDLLFKYDAMGNRVAKVVFHKNIAAGSPDVTYTHYVRDANGNVMAVYSQDQSALGGTSFEDQIKLDEFHLYGSSRMGLKNMNYTLYSGVYPNAGLNGLGERTTGTASSSVPGIFDPSMALRNIGDKNYELSNHLGNVLVVVTDKRTGVDSDNDNDIDHFLADVSASNDYYPFGMIMSDRNQSADDYRYGFNGMEKDDEVKGNGNSYDFGARLYDSRLGKWFSLDPLANKYSSLSPYNFVANTPIQAMDLDGREIILAAGLTKEEKLIIVGTLQKLTNDKLVYKTMNDGSVRVLIASTGEGKKDKGTSLIRQLNSSDHKVTIDMGAAGSGNSASASNMTDASDPTKGTSGSVNFDKTSSPSIKTLDPATGNVAGQTGRPNAIGLGHELIHVLHYFEGTRATSTDTDTYTYQTGSAVPATLTTPAIPATTVTQTVKKEELRTVGLKGASATDVTENDLRKEQRQAAKTTSEKKKSNPRGAY